MIEKLTIPISAFEATECIYVIEIISTKNEYYVGKTGSKNGTGYHISFPFKRLSKHLVFTQSNKTFSIIKDKNFNLKNTSVNFHYLRFKNNNEINFSLAEKYLIYIFTERKLSLLNKNIPNNFNNNFNKILTEEKEKINEFFKSVTEKQQ